MRFYKLLLHLYPASFRHEYGDEMAAIFRDRLRHADGLSSRLALLFGACSEVTGNAVILHWDLLRQDLRQALRTYLRSPAFALTAIVVVALGTGANTAVFSVTDYVLFRPLPFPSPERLLKLWENRAGYSQMELSPANYRDWKERVTTLESMAAYSRTAANLVGKEGDPVRLDGAMVGWELFRVLGVGSKLGRAFTEADERPGAPAAVLLSNRLWQSRYGGNPGVLGQIVRLDWVEHTVVGVMSPTFLFPHRDVEYWVPLQITEEMFLDRNDNFLEVVARMRDGVTLEQVRADVGRIAGQLAQEYPVENQNAGATIYRMRQEYSQQSRLLLLAMAGAAICVLLITCVNLANLLLARALARRRELLVRAAMGAGRERLARQLLTESLLLSLAGGALGIGVAFWSLPLLSRLVPTTLPVETRPSIDLRVLLFAGALTLLTGIVVGLLPVMRATRGGFSALRDGFSALADGDRSGGGRRERLRSALVVAGIVCSVVLLISAGLLLRALWRVQSVDPGFRTADVLTLRVALPQPKYSGTKHRLRFYGQVVEEIRALPGVSNAAFTSFLPMTMTGGIWPVITDGSSGRRERGNVASLRFVTPGFFDTLDIPLLLGRDVSLADRANQPFVTVVSQSFVERYFPHRSPIGERFEFGFFEREIVGVVGDIRVRGLERPSEPQVYLPAGQVPDGWLQFYTPKDLAIRATVPPESLLPAVREILRDADPYQPISSVRTMAQIVANQTASRTVQLNVVVAFAGIALLLAAIGIHGLLSFLVSQRRREIGVRVALGAARSDIVRMVIGRGAALAAIGVAIGGLVAYAAGRSLEAILAGVPAADPLTFASVAGLCAAMTFIGSLFPALRALRVDPAKAIRVE